jgi:hypothetical protein
MQEITFTGFKFQIFSGGVFMSSMSATWLSPTNILSHSKVHFQKMPPSPLRILPVFILSPHGVNDSFRSKVEDAPSQLHNLHNFFQRVHNG